MPPWLFGRPPSGADAPCPVRVRTLLTAVPRDMFNALKEEELVADSSVGLEDRLNAVDNLLAGSPDLAAVVSATVVAIHPLSAPPGYDVSHSQPKWRDRIFVSFPERDDEVGALRLAESVVHEAMHLHLTNEEARTPFVATMSDTAYSPWRGTARAVQGVLHGVFVFSCIHFFLSTVKRCGHLSQNGHKHLRGRLDDIEREISEVDYWALQAALTPEGVVHLRSWCGMGLAHSDLLI